MQFEVNRSNFADMLRLALKRANGNVTALARELKVSPKGLDNWLKNPYTRIIKFDSQAAKVQEYLNQPHVSGPNPSSLARIWQSMRCMRNFTLGEIVATANTTERYTLQVLQTLVKAGYLQTRTPEHGAARIYVLVKNTGPNAPKLGRRSDSVYDKNLEQLVWESKA